MPETAKQDVRILFVEDSVDDVDLTLRQLARAGIRADHRIVSDRPELTHALREGPWDLVISDFRMPRFDGLEAFDVVQQTGLNIPFIFVSGMIGEERAKLAIERGARDYIPKEDLSRLVPVVRRELNRGEPSPAPSESPELPAGFRRMAAAARRYAVQVRSPNIEVRARAADDLVQLVDAALQSAARSGSARLHQQRPTRGRAQYAGPEPTPRQTEVLRLIAEGHTTKEIAAALGITPKTAGAHRSGLMSKLDIHSTAALVRYAIRRGLIRP